MVKSRIFLQVIFLCTFLYSVLSFNYNTYIACRILFLTVIISALFLLYVFLKSKRSLSNIFNINTFFYIAFSLTQTLVNIHTMDKPYALLYEIMHYGITIFILSYSLKNKRFLDIGIVLFIIFSFRIFDKGLSINEFVFIHALSLILALLWAEELVIKKTSYVNAKNVYIFLFLFAIMILFSNIKSICLHESLIQTAIMLNFIFVGFLISNYTRTIKQLKLFMVVLLILGGLLFFLVLQERIFELLQYGKTYLFDRLWISREGNFRIHSNSIAGYFSALLFLCLVCIRLFKDKLSNYLFKSFFVCMLLSLFLTYSRLGIFSFIFSFVVFLLLCKTRIFFYLKKNYLYILSFVLLGIVFIFFTPVKYQILSRIKDSYGTQQTFLSCLSGIMAFTDRPFLGFGLNNYYILSKYIDSNMLGIFSLPLSSARNVLGGPIHSLYITLLFSTGLLGFLAFLFLMGSIIRYTIRLNRYIEKNKFESLFLHGVFAAILTVIIHGVFAMTFHLTILPAFFWVLIGLLISVGNVANFNKTRAINDSILLRVCICFFAILLGMIFVVTPIIAQAIYIDSVEGLNPSDLSSTEKRVIIASEIDPINPEYYVTKADIAFSKGELNLAENYYNQALFLKNDYAPYYFKLAQTYGSMRLQEREQIQVEKLKELDKFALFFDYYSILGSLYKEMGARDQMIEQFKNAVLMNRELPCDESWEGRPYLDEIILILQKDILEEKKLLYKNRDVLEIRFLRDECR